MQNEKLLIVAIRGANGMPELEKGAEGLYNKYSGRTTINKEVEMVYVTSNGEISSRKGKLTLAEGDKLGMYVVSHCHDFGESICDNNNLVTNVKKNILDEKNKDGNYILDKVGLVVCIAAKLTNKTGPEVLNDENEKIMISRFAKLLLAAGLHPRLTGWIGYVTVDETGKKRIIGSSNLKEDYASEMSVSKEKQKMVYVWESSTGYVRKDFKSWTDKK
jgi:hypothetical protein